MTSTADLYDELGDSVQSLSLQLLDLGGNVAFEGPVRTVKCFEDNALLKSILGTPGEGAVLVVDGAGSMRSALMGDMIAQSAVDNGWAGIIINGPVRDRAALAEMPFGVKALGSNPRKSAKLGTGVADETIEIAGVVFRPGAKVWADEDGVLVER